MALFQHVIEIHVLSTFVKSRLKQIQTHLAFKIDKSARMAYSK